MCLTCCGLGLPVAHLARPLCPAVGCTRKHRLVRTLCSLLYFCWSNGCDTSCRTQAKKPIWSAHPHSSLFRQRRIQPEYRLHAYHEIGSITWMVAACTQSARGHGHLCHVMLSQSCSHICDSYCPVLQSDWPYATDK